jgi:hypothetical protein
VSTLTIITIVVAGLLCLNSVAVVVLRRRRGVAAAPLRRRQLTRTGVALYAVMVALLVVGIAVPPLAPESAIAAFINNAGIFVYGVWCVVGTTVATVILHLMHMPLWKSEGAV